MKRMREDEVESSSIAAKCLMLLQAHHQPIMPIKLSSAADVFECKTCNRRFSSFQALGGHRASHKKPKLIARDHGNEEPFVKKVANNKRHECTICGVVFSMGQALGGHMRRHRAATDDVGFSSLLPIPAQPLRQVLKRSNSSIKACSWLDLNLTPLENDLNILFGKMAPNFDTKFIF